MTKNLNVAYDILSNEEKRKEYDQEYHKHKSNDFSDEFQEDINFDDVKDYYQEEEIYYTEMLALKQVIHEELDKVSAILDYKINLLNSIKSSDISDEDYLYLINEFIEVVNSYFEELDNLKDRAKKYSLNIEIDKINNAINHLNDEIDNIPSTLQDAKFYFDELKLRDRALKKLTVLKNNYQVINDKINSITKYINDGKINKFNYKDIVSGINSEIEDLKIKLQDLAKVLEALNLNKECNEALELLKMLTQETIKLIPDDFNNAKILSKIFAIKIDAQDIFTDEVDIQKKLIRILNILKKHNYSKRYEQLHNYAINKISERKQTLKDIYFRAMNVKNNKNVVNSQIITQKEIQEAYDKAEDLNKSVDKIFSELLEKSNNSTDGFSEKSKKTFKNLIYKKQKAFFEKTSVIDKMIDTNILCDILDIDDIQSIDSYYDTIISQLINQLHYYKSLSYNFNDLLDGKKNEALDIITSLENELDESIDEINLSLDDKLIFILTITSILLTPSLVIATLIGSDINTIYITSIPTFIGTIAGFLAIGGACPDDNNVKHPTTETIKNIVNVFRKYYNKMFISDEKKEKIESEISIKKKKLDYHKNIFN